MRSKELLQIKDTFMVTLGVACIFLLGFKIGYARSKLANIQGVSIDWSDIFFGPIFALVVIGGYFVARTRAKQVSNSD